MTIIQVSIQDAATTLLSLVEAVEKNGTWVRICRNGNPVADLRPAAGVANPLLQDSNLSKVSFNEDPMLPLAAEDWPMDAR